VRSKGSLFLWDESLGPGHEKTSFLTVDLLNICKYGENAE
jgi:hypothetical protein